MYFTRPATLEDEPFLWRMLAYASWAGPDEDVHHVPYLVRYVEGWGRPGDLGVIAERRTTSAQASPVGAAWLRLPTVEDRADEMFVAPDVAELSIAVEPDERGAGLGGRLLADLIDRARAEGRFRGVVLSTRLENPAVRLYERLGFVQVNVIS